MDDLVHRLDGGRGDAVIEARGLTKIYGDRRVVDELTLTVPRGSIFGLLGPNGAGKTTTILMLLGLTEPTYGEARVLGLDPRRQPLEIKRRVGYLPDDVGFYPDMTARQNLRYTAKLNRIPKRDAEEAIEALLGDVGLSDAADRPVGGFSRGMRQRLGLADALVKSPEIVVLDEPTVNIDPVGVREITALVRRLRDERALTVLLSSHLLHQVQEVCDEVAMFIGGHLVAQGTVAQLAARLHQGCALDLRTRGTGDLVRQALRAVPGVVVTEVSAEQDETLWHVTSARDVRSEVVQVLVGAGIDVCELVNATASLEEVYARHAAEAGGGRTGGVAA